VLNQRGVKYVGDRAVTTTNKEEERRSDTHPPLPPSHPPTLFLGDQHFVDGVAAVLNQRGVKYVGDGAVTTTNKEEERRSDTHPPLPPSHPPSLFLGDQPQCSTSVMSSMWATGP